MRKSEILFIAQMKSPCLGIHSALGVGIAVNAEKAFSSAPPPPPPAAPGDASFPAALLTEPPPMA